MSSSAGRRRTVTPRWRTSVPGGKTGRKKVKAMAEILEKAKYAEVKKIEDGCEECGWGEGEKGLVLCEKAIVVRPHTPLTRFSQRKIIDFFRIRKVTQTTISPQDLRKRRRRSGTLAYQKKRRRLLPFIPSEVPAQRMKQMGTLATALTALHMEFADDLTYQPSMAPRSANQAKFEDGGMQVLSKEDLETLEQCRSMSKRGECPPLLVVFDSREGYTVEVDGQIKDMTFIAEYTGDVDYIKNRQHDDCDSLMTLLLAKDPCKSLVICPDKRGNIARFINGINNHTPDGKKKQNCKCVRYDVNGESRVFLVATRDIARGERLYYDYNGYEHEYSTQHFV